MQQENKCVNEPLLTRLEAPGRGAQSLRSPGFPPVLIQLYRQALWDPEDAGNIRSTTADLETEARGGLSLLGAASVLLPNLPPVIGPEHP